MDNPSAIDWYEMFEYLPDTVVELKKEPGIPRRIDYYEATIDNPRPHYPHELRILSRRTIRACDLAVLV
jgi:hypothetical protein